jgi:hypothetical protein
MRRRSSLRWALPRTAVLCILLACAGCQTQPETLQTRLFKRGQPPVELFPGATLTTGDELYLTVKTQRPLHVYVVSEDAAGDRRLIYPCSNWKRSQRLGAGLHRLPPRLLERETFWQTGSLTARERLLVIASVRPVDLLDPTRVATASLQPCAAAIAAEASRWLDTWTARRNRDVWISAYELQGASKP